MKTREKLGYKTHSPSHYSEQKFRVHSVTSTQIQGFKLKNQTIQSSRFSLSPTALPGEIRESDPRREYRQRFSLLFSTFIDCPKSKTLLVILAESFRPELPERLEICREFRTSRRGFSPRVSRVAFIKRFYIKFRTPLAMCRC